MRVTVENAGGLERRMRVEIPEDLLEAEIESRLLSMARSVKIAGFRPGKVPLKVVASRYGRKIRAEVVGEMVRSSFYEALAKESLRPAGSPTIDPLDSESGQGVAYTAIFEVFPEVELPCLEGIKIVRKTAEVAEDDVDRMVSTLREQRKTWHRVERPAQDSDRIVVDYVGVVDGEEFEGGRATDASIELGTGRMLPAFEQGLVGKAEGDEIVLELVFPEDFHSQALAGKQASFDVKVHRVEESQLPEVDEEFARSFGVSEGGLDEFRREVRTNLERELEDAMRLQAKREVMDSLLQTKSFELPRTLVDQEKETIREQHRRQLRLQGLDPEGIKLESDQLDDQARRRVALGLLLAELVRSQDIKPDPEYVKARVASIASTYDNPEEIMRWYYENPDRLKGVESTALEEEVVKWVLERADVTEEKTSFDALVNPGQTTKS